MKKSYAFLATFLLLISTWAIAEEVELLDAYLEDLPSNTSTNNLDSNVIVGQPVDIVVDENGQSREVIRPQAMEYRKIDTADGSELYEEVPVQSAAPTTKVIVANTAVEPAPSMNSEVAVNDENTGQNKQDLEVIELEPEGELSVIEVTGNQSGQTTASKKRSMISGQNFCYQNPYARECLLSKYLSLCEKDPQSLDCKSQLQKFDNFCETFPNAYKCKKAKIAASCKENPENNACKSFAQRFCQKYPNAIFCNYN